MAKAVETKKVDKGITKLENGNYEVRIVINRKDLKINTIRRSDEDGNPFKSITAARDFRERFIVAAKQQKPEEQSTVKDCTLREVYEKYRREGSYDKAPSTLRKQESMWENHIERRFGDKLISQITLDDLSNYLKQLYAYGDDYNPNANYSYKYIEGFLKFFYLLFGCAYADDRISTDRYTKMFLDKNTRLSMPEITQEDKEEYDDVKVYTKSEIAQLDEIFKRGNCHLAFLLGYYCGLRISEVFAVTFDDFYPLENKIKVNKQLLYQNGVWCLCPVKTLQAVREIDLPPFLTKYMSQVQHEQMRRMAESEDGEMFFRNNEVVIDKTKREHKKVVGGRFFNRKENGELLTPNSIKYWSKVIEKELGIDFKFHSLRKTHATMMANANTPALELMQRLGHKKYETTMKYYIDNNQLAKEKLKANLLDLQFSAADIKLDDAADPFEL